MAPQGRGEMQSVGPLSVVTDPGVCLAGTGMWEYLRRATRMERRQQSCPQAPFASGSQRWHLPHAPLLTKQPHCLSTKPVHPLTSADLSTECAEILSKS